MDTSSTELPQRSNKPVECDRLQQPHKPRNFNRHFQLVVVGVLSFVVVLGLTVFIMAYVSSKNDTTDLVQYTENTDNSEETAEIDATHDPLSVRLRRQAICFQCRTSSACLPFAWVCDGIMDCSDNSDEDGQTCGDTTTNPEVVTTLAQTTQSITEPATPCSSDPCENQASCLNAANLRNYFCLCQPGWTGRNCQNSPPACNSNECHSSALCVQMDFGAACICAPGYYGEKCDLDITECDSQPCRNGATCWDGPNQYFCSCADGYTGSDCEIAFTCGNNQFDCGDSFCITLDWVCDLIVDCSDERDEKFCSSCSDSEFNCNNGDCISPDLVCNKQNDCLNNRDELGCPEVSTTIEPSETTRLTSESRTTTLLTTPDYTTTRSIPTPVKTDSPSPCTNDEFYCGVDSECIPSIWVCDIIPDCSNNRDELYCCADPSDFNCYDGQCVEQESVCDGVNNCNNGRDEGNCQYPTTSTPTTTTEQLTTLYESTTVTTITPSASTTERTTAASSSAPETTTRAATTPMGTTGLQPTDYPVDYCGEDQFTCGDGFCVSSNWACDAIMDCTDGRDERYCDCTVSEFNCFNGQCVSNGLKCNQQDDCGNNLDELGCPVNECFSSPCQNGATCIDGELSYICVCAPDFAGENCEDAVEECSPNYCQHGGYCSDAGRTATCYCMSGYTGKRCELDVNDCDGAPASCHEFGVCLDGIGQFWCICNPGYNGIYCQQDSVRECQSNPCPNGATCSETPNGFHCGCPSGFKGRLCDQDVIECNSSPCVNGQCFDSINQYYCDCFEGYTGKHCETETGICGPDTVVCDEGSYCITRDQLCDGVQNCQDGVDERDCRVLCEDDEIPCDADKCIRPERVCNGVADCLDGIDERNCTYCEPDEHTCDNATCISIESVCDGITDCQDSTDELDCPVTCAPDQHLCDADTCLSLLSVCDGYYDCDDETDELNCPVTCAADDFLCDNDKCIIRFWVCDEIADCDDDTDESDCIDTTVVPTTPMSTTLLGGICERSQFLCDTDTCISSYWVCDDIPDCVDDTDENNCQGTTLAPSTTTEILITNGTTAASTSILTTEYYVTDLQTETLSTSSTPTVFESTIGTTTSIPTTYATGTLETLPSTASTLRTTLVTDGCEANQFSCDSDKCIRASWVCDTIIDCDDTTDESDCQDTTSPSATSSSSPTTPTEVTCGPDEVVCDVDKCIYNVWVCDGIIDCYDRTDESSCQETTEVPTTPTISPSANDIFGTGICGTRPAYNPSQRIIGGSDAEMGKWPWICSMRERGSGIDVHFCACTLVHEQWAVTAAHCVETILDALDFVIVFGENDPTMPSTYGVERGITRVINYPGYIGGTTVDDIAMLKLDTPVEFTDYVRPACVATSQEEEADYGASNCSIAGWGETMYNDTTECYEIPSEVEDICGDLLPYNRTYFPNSYSGSVVEAISLFNEFYPVTSLCSRPPNNDAAQYLCALFFPSCPEDTNIVHCQSLCNRVRDNCAPYVPTFSWPDCTRQPDSGDTLCEIGKEGEESDDLGILQEADIPLIPTEDCQGPRYGYGSRITENMICHGFQEGGVDTCQGDSGGPMVCSDSEGLQTLVGITSWGEGCGLAAYPGVLTRVSSFTDFMMDAVNEDDECLVNEFSCDNGECVLASLLCNGRSECSDDSDEKDCIVTTELVFTTKEDILTTGGVDITTTLTTTTKVPCQDYEFDCGNTCIPSFWECDAIFDCPSGEDEIYCCEGEQFACANGRCVNSSSVCDSNNDCGDGSDEWLCGGTCGPDEFQCKTDGQCIPDTSVCDLYEDCADASDEPDDCIVSCSPNDFLCDNDYCIISEWVCDDFVDCNDSTDELNCPSPVP